MGWDRRARKRMWEASEVARGRRKFGPNKSANQDARVEKAFARANRALDKKKGLASGDRYFPVAGQLHRNPSMPPLLHRGRKP